MLRKIVFFSTTLIFISLVLCLCLVLILSWQETLLRSYVNQFTQDKINQGLPRGYSVNELRLEWDLKELLTSASLSAQATLVSPHFNLFVQGPIGLSNFQSIWILLKRPPSTWSVYSEPHVYLISENSQQTPILDFKLNLSIDATTHVPLTLNLKWTSYPQQYFYLDQKWDFSPFTGQLSYEECQIDYSLQSQSLRWHQTDLSAQLSLNLSGSLKHLCHLDQLQSHHQLTFKDLMLEYPSQNLTVALVQLESEIKTKGLSSLAINSLSKGQALELLWGDKYLDPPIENYMIHFDLLSDLNEGFKPIALSMEAQHIDKKNYINLEVSSSNLLDTAVTKDTRISSQFDLAEIKKMSPPMPLAGWEVDGSIQSQIGLQRTGTDWKILKGSTLDFKNFLILNKEIRHQTDQLNLKLTAQKQNQFIVDLNIPSIRQLNWHGALGPWKIPIKYVDGTIDIPVTQIPLKIQGLDIQLKPLKVDVQFKDQLKYSLTTGLSLPPTPLKSLSEQICISPEVTPAGTLSLNYPHLRLSNNQVSTQGSGQLDVFGGQISIDEFEIDQVFSHSPITFLSAKWERLELGEIGDFTKFGGMVGHASGHLKNVGFMGTLLKDYDFKFSLEPRLAQSKFYFSRRATQNLIEIFAQGQGLSQGPANAILRLSSRILGDYGISYAGLRAHTQNNFVILETFDPPEVVRKENTRYLLYGSRIKMPLSTQTYPVILSKNGWNGFVYYFRDSLLTLMQQKNRDLAPGEDSALSTQATPVTTTIPCFEPNLGQQNRE
jgi:hypothetical protein